MAVKTNSELNGDALVIKNEIGLEANTADRIGQMLVDLNESKLNINRVNYYTYSALVDLSAGPVFNVIELTNNLAPVTFTFTNPSGGLITVTASVGLFTDGATLSLGSSFNNAGTPYFLSGSRFSDTVFNFRIALHDGTAASTPFFTGVFFEIRIYIL